MPELLVIGIAIGFVIGCIGALILNQSWYRLAQKQNDEWAEFCKQQNERWSKTARELIGGVNRD